MKRDLFAVALSIGLAASCLAIGPMVDAGGAAQAQQLVQGATGSVTSAGGQGAKGAVSSAQGAAGSAVTTSAGS